MNLNPLHFADDAAKVDHFAPEHIDISDIADALMHQNISEPKKSHRVPQCGIF